MLAVTQKRSVKYALNIYTWFTHGLFCNETCSKVCTVCWCINISHWPLFKNVFCSIYCWLGFYNYLFSVCSVSLGKYTEFCEILSTGGELRVLALKSTFPNLRCSGILASKQSAILQICGNGCIERFMAHIFHWERQKNARMTALRATLHHTSICPKLISS